MEVSGQLHAPAALSQENSPRYPFDVHYRAQLTEIMLFQSYEV